MMSGETQKYIVYFIHTALFVLLLAQTYNKAFRPIGNDLCIFIDAAETLLHGDDPRETIWPYPYFFSFAFIPFVFIPLGVSVCLWFLLNTTALFVIFHIVKESYWAETLRKDRLPVLWVQMAVLLFMLPVIQNDFLNGQVNFIILLLCLLFMKFYSDGHRVLSALFLALAILLKVVPGILVLFLLVRREWAIVALTALLVFLLSLLPYITMGNAIFPAYLDYFHYLAKDRLSFELTITHDIFLTFHDVVNLFIRSIGSRLIAWMLNILWLLGLAALDSYQRKHRVPLGDLWMVGLYLTSTLLISPLSEMHHIVLIIPVVFLYLLTNFLERPPLSRHYLWKTALFFGLLSIGKLFKDAPFLFLGLIVLCLAVAEILWNERSLRRTDDVMEIPLSR